MSGTGWKRERAAWVMTRAGRSPAARRRGEKLIAAARRQDRHAVDAGDSASSEVTTRNIFYRSVMREEGPANIIGWFLWTVIWMAAVGLAIGPAIAIAWGIYASWYALLPRLGRLRAAPLFGAAALTAVLGAALFWFIGQNGGSTTLLGYAVIQITVALCWAAWLTRAYGWRAVADRDKAQSSKIAPISINIPTTVDPVDRVQPEEIIVARDDDMPVEDEPDDYKPVATIVVAAPDYEVDYEDLDREEIS